MMNSPIVRYVALVVVAALGASFVLFVTDPAFNADFARAALTFGAISVSTIDMIDWFSPMPRTRFAVSPYSPAQLKQRTGLFAVSCSGYSTAKLD